MSQAHLIPAQTLCKHYNIEISFVTEIHQMGLITIEVIEENQFLHEDQIGNLEKIIRLHFELAVNLEGIDVILNLLDKERVLQTELIALRNRLRLYEEV